MFSTDANFNVVLGSPAFRATQFNSPDGESPSSSTVVADSLALRGELGDDGDEEGEDPFPAMSPRFRGSFAQRKGNNLHGATDRLNHTSSWFMIVIYGCINVAVSVPSLYGYAGMILREPAYAAALPDLAKLVILSSAVHQLVFSYKSSLPFGIAQVQDAGLIFLSSMASKIASSTANAEEAVATAVVLLSLATAALGLCVYIVGRFRWASVVSALPAPVVAGYLAFIGFFCLAAGLGLACSKSIATWQGFAELNEFYDWVLIAPALASGFLMALVSRRATQWWALPVCIVTIPLIFYAILAAQGISLEGSRVNGWVAPDQGISPPIRVLEHFALAKVKWSVAPKLFLTWASMTLIVVFASALDIVAVEMDLAGTAELDIDRELETVGISNLISGALGGYSGSYIFSQTIFTRRTGMNTRAIGVFLALAELALFLAPVSLISYVPRFFFAATLIFIAFDLLYEWLFHVAFRVSSREYALVLLTFFAITFTDDLILGITMGFMGAIINFISLYGAVDPVLRGTHTSNVLRDHEARKILAVLSPNRIISLRVSGFLFFGSATLLVRRVREFLAKDMAAEHVGSPRQRPSLSRTQYGTIGGASSPSASSRPTTTTTQVRRFLVLDFAQVSGLDATAVTSGLMRIRMLSQTHNVSILFVSLSPATRHVLERNGIISSSSSSSSSSTGHNNGDVDVFENINDALDRCEEEILRETRGLDAIVGSSKSAFFPSQEEQQQQPQPRGGSVVLNMLHRSVSWRRFRYPTQPNIPALVWDTSNSNTSSNAQTMESLNVAHRRARASFVVLVEAFFGWSPEGTRPSMTREQMTKLATYFELRALRQGVVVFDDGDVPDCVFVVICGEVVLYRGTREWRKLSREAKERIKAQARSNHTANLVFGRDRRLIQRARFGSMFGDLAFTLQHPRRFGAITEQDTVLFALTRDAAATMERQDPQLMVGFMKMVSRSLGLTLLNIQDFAQQRQGGDDNDA